MATTERDLYEVLGVERGASDGEIKRAFRKLDPPDQQALLEAFRRGAERIDASNRESDAQALQALVELGVQKAPVSPEYARRWRQIGQAVGDQLVSEGQLDGALLAELRRVVADAKQP